MKKFLQKIFQGDKEKRTCIFCGGTPLTREHIYPKWSFELFNIPAQTFHPITTVIFTTGSRGTNEDELTGLLNDDRDVFYRDFAIKAVCAKCNGGWMSSLEIKIKSLFTRLLQEEGFASVTPGESYDLSLWCIMKTILAAKTVPFAQQVEPWMLEFISKGIIPEGFIVEAIKLPQNFINFTISTMSAFEPYLITQEEMHLAEDNSLLGGLHLGPFGFRVSFLRTAGSAVRVQIIDEPLLLYPFHGRLPFMDGRSDFDRSSMPAGDELNLFCSRLKLIDNFKIGASNYDYAERISILPGS